MKLPQLLTKKKKKKLKKPTEGGKWNTKNLNPKKIQEMRFKKKQKTDGAIRKQKQIMPKPSAIVPGSSSLLLEKDLTNIIIFTKSR